MKAIVMPRKTSRDRRRPGFSGIISPMFSDIVQRFDVPLNPLYRERDARKARGLKTLDLVSGNMNREGFQFPSRIFGAALAAGSKRARTYSPDPLGQPI